MARRPGRKTRAACTTSPRRSREDARASLRRDTVALLLAAKDGTLAARLLPDVKDTVGHLTRTLEISGRDLNPVVLYIDPETALITSRPLRRRTVRGRSSRSSSPTTVGGRGQVAFKATRRSGPLSVERSVTDIKINPPIDSALFKRPAS